MSSFLLIMSILGMGLIIFWYVFDEAARDGEGRSGLLSMGSRKDADQGKPHPGWKSSGRKPWRVGRH